MTQAVCSAFKALGGTFAVQHGRAVNLGETKCGLTLKPEHVDLKLFEHVGESGGAVLEAAIAEARTVQGATAPYFVGVKMHDNDFFAAQSAWTYVYLDGARRPPWDPSRRAPLKPQAEQDAMWTLYEAAVRRAAEMRDEVGLVNLRQVAAMVPS